MNFLQAHAALKSFAGGPPLRMLVAMSGTGEPMELYVRAAAALQGRSAEARFLPFGTLQQSLLEPPADHVREVLVLFPWDFVPALDWRTGIASTAVDPSAARHDAEAIAMRIAARRSAVVYVNAPVAPASLSVPQNASLRTALRAIAEDIGGTVVDEHVFGLGSYLASGQPIAPKAAGELAQLIVSAALAAPRGGAKVLVTDLDHTLWHGVIGDDGLDGIQFRAEGKGYRHFVYQTLLRRLKHDGVLLAAVSKNDDEVARGPFKSKEMVLAEEDFVAIVASWQPKSTQITMLAEQLNLGLDAFVFVDDNPLEIAEVSSALPAVRCVQFPAGEQGFESTIGLLVELFESGIVTNEDRERTALYRRRLATLPPREGAGADVRGFLAGLEMALVIEDRTLGDRTRAVQLINKTNQFNINGRRLEDVEVERLLSDGSRLFTASLSDKSGDHGQILAGIISADGTLVSLVMSCRVFQRRVEHAFFAWLMREGFTPRFVQFMETERNGPTRSFFEQFVDGPIANGTVSLDLTRVEEQLSDALALFTLSAPVLRR